MHRSFAASIPTRRLAIALTAFILTLALPITGGVVTGLPAVAWTEFPPRHLFVRHAGFQWPAFLGLAIVLAACLAPVARRMLKAGKPVGSAPRPDRQPRRFPVWGWMALAWMLGAWFLAWTRFPWFAPLQHDTYILVWAGFVVLVQAGVQHRAGTCQLTRQPAAWLSLALVSAAFWWGFEFLNRAGENWFYRGLEGFTPAAYARMATLSFMTVLPAVLGVHDWLATFPRLTASLNGWRPMRSLLPRRAGVRFAVAGAAGLFLLPLAPNLLFPLLWLAPLAVLCGLLAAAGEPTLFDAVGSGDWRVLVRLSLAALICGFFWEMWNFYSLAHWVYEVPYVGRFKVFEMPVLGYAGYLPFGWECAAVAMVFGLWQPPQAPMSRV